MVVELSDKLLFKQGRQLLRPSGTFVASLPRPTEILFGFANNVFSKQKFAPLGMRARTEVLASLATEVGSGAVEVVIGQTFPLTAYPRGL